MTAFGTVTGLRYGAHTRVTMCDSYCMYLSYFNTIRQDNHILSRLFATSIQADNITGPFSRWLIPFPSCFTYCHNGLFTVLNCRLLPRLLLTWNKKCILTEMTSPFLILNIQEQTKTDENVWCFKAGIILYQRDYVYGELKDVSRSI